MIMSSLLPARFATRTSAYLARTALASVLALAAAGIATPARSESPPIGTPVDATALAQRLAGPGVTVANASYTGAKSAVAAYVNGTAVGLASGVVLSTGPASETLGRRDVQRLGTVFGEPGDAALDARVAPQLTEDAAILTFDVTTAQDAIAIRYVFASDEYAGTVQEDFSDVLAIDVDGVSCANVNGVPVGVHAISATSNAALFIDNDAGARATPFPGLTVPLECVAAVTPNVPHRVRIAIADAGDGAFDSAVFVAEGGVRGVSGMTPTTSHVVKAVEFRHVDGEQYFVTSHAGEIASLDAGALAHDWVRTGAAFNASVAGTGGAAPMCRFFGPAFPPVGAHFFTPVAEECALVKTNPAWQFEGIAFGLAPADAQGECASGTRPVYRLYNDGMGGAPGHRYTTDRDVAGDMRLKGWIPEGAGDGVIGCAAS